MDERQAIARASSAEVKERWLQLSSEGLALEQARKVLEEENEQGADATVGLQRTVARHLAAVARDMLAPPPPQIGVNHLAWEFERDGMHSRDADAVDFLAALGEEGSTLRKEGRAAADQWRAKAVERFLLAKQQRVLPGVPEPEEWAKWRAAEQWQERFAFVIASVLWHGEVKAEVKAAREKGRTKPPGVALLVVNDLERVCWSRGRQLELIPQGDGTARAELRDASGEVLATVPVLAGDEMEQLQRGADLLHSYTGHLTIRRLAEEGHRRTLNEEPQPSVLSFQGGVAGFAEWLGAASEKVRAEATDVLQAGQQFHRRWAGGEIGGLWTYALAKAAPGRRAFLEVRLGRPLMPYFAKQFLSRQYQQIVPVVAMPPRVGRSNEWAAQAAFQFRLVRAMVERRTDLVTKGGAMLTMDELARLAVAVGLPVETVAKVMDRWTSDGDDGLACLERVERDRYHLADNPAYRDARAFLVGGGLRSLAKRKAAQASVRARNAPRRRRDPKG